MGILKVNRSFDFYFDGNFLTKESQNIHSRAAAATAATRSDQVKRGAAERQVITWYLGLFKVKLSDLKTFTN